MKKVIMLAAVVAALTKQDFHFKRKTADCTQGSEQKTCDCC